LDAGITYVTEVVARRGRVEGIEIPEEHNVVAEYPIAVLAGAPNPGAAAAFVAFVLSDEGQAILRNHGFAAPGAQAWRVGGGLPRRSPSRSGSPPAWGS